MQPSITKEDYPTPEQYRDHILEQYRIYVERTTAEQSEDEKTNNFFLTVNTAVVTALAFSSQGDFVRGNVGAGFVMLPAVTICVVWWITLRSMARWNLAQIETLQEMERHLPLNPFTIEWHEKVAPQKTYIKIRVIRQVVPWIFVAVHVGMYLSIVMK